VSVDSYLPVMFVSLQIALGKITRWV